MQDNGKGVIMTMTQGYRLYNGAIATASFAESYNRMSHEIDWKAERGADVNVLRDCRHRFFVSFAMVHKPII